ncbi:MAG: acyl carrier protein, partial [Chloroflexota bacterium]
MIWSEKMIGSTPIQSEAAVRDVIRQVLAEMFGLTVAEVGDAFSMADELAWDSLRHLTVIVTLEDQFGVNYTSQEIPQMTNLSELTRVTTDHLG